MLEGKGKNGYFKLGAVEVEMEPGTPQQMSIDFFDQNPIKNNKLIVFRHIRISSLEYNSIGAARIVGEPGEILALATKLKRMVMSAIGNPAEEFTERAELNEILESQADSDAAYQDVIKAGKMVVAMWDKGNLAGAVSDLDRAIRLLEGR